MSGKGSAPRPFTVDDKTFAENWERTFGASPEVLVHSSSTHSTFDRYMKGRVDFLMSSRRQAKPITVTVPADLVGPSIDGNAAASNSAQAGSSPAAPAIYIDNATGA